MTDPLPPADPPLPVAVRVGTPTYARALPIAARVVYPRLRVEHRHDTPNTHPSFVPLIITMGAFAAMMIVSFGHIAYLVVQSIHTTEPTEDEARHQLIRDTVICEGLDTVIVLVGLLAAGWPAVRRSELSPVYAWSLAAPMLVLFLGLNIGYSFALQWIFPPDPEAVSVDIGLSDGWWAILLVCVQPAVVEELFFRYLLFGHLRRHLGVHASVWLSAVVFGIAHVGNVGGWPVLIVLGAGLGYARAYSNGLMLPIGLHFAHNLAVLAAGEILGE